MKRLAIIFFVVIPSFAKAQTDSTEYLKKVESIDAIVETLYGVISGEKGEERDWDLFNYLFKDGCHMIPSGKAGVSAIQ